MNAIHFHADKYESKSKSMYIFFSGETQSQKVMIVDREEVN